METDPLETIARQANKSHPTAKWLASWREAIADYSPEEVRAWCRLRIEAPEETPEALGAVFGIAEVASAGTATQLGAWALQWHKSGRLALAGAAITALGAIAVQPDRAMANEAIGQLQRLKTRLRHRTLTRRIDEALKAVANTRGLSAEALQDLVVEDAGLESNGQRCWEAGPYQLYLFLSDDGAVTLTIFDVANGRALANPPKALKQDHYRVLAEIKAVQKVLTETLATQKARLEQAMIDGRSWRYADWREVFGPHPLMRHLAQRLVWRIDDVDAAATEGALVPLSGDGRAFSDDASVRVAHPAEAREEALAAWRLWVIQARRVQPFKQAFREIYAPREEDAPYYTERFAGTSVRHIQLYALLRARGWQGLSGIGPNGYVGERKLEARGVTAVLGFRPHGQQRDRQRRLVDLERLEFYPIPLPEWQPGHESRLPLGEVDMVAFSEAVRDVALVVGQARAQDDASAVAVRASLFKALLPQLGLENKVTIDGGQAWIPARRERFRLDLANGKVSLEDGRSLDLSGFERIDTPLYLPHEAKDQPTMEILSTLLWLAQLAQRM
ncbi:MAG TPA: DUF4132 domain-containing protein [Oscillatoriaceae cyanobacterium]